MRIDGRLSQDRWNDPEGKPRSRIEIVAEHMEFKPKFNQDKAKDGEAWKASRFSMTKVPKVIEESVFG